MPVCEPARKGGGCMEGARTRSMCVCVCVCVCVKANENCLFVNMCVKKYRKKPHF